MKWMLIVLFIPSCGGTAQMDEYRSYPTNADCQAAADILDKEFKAGGVGQTRFVCIPAGH